ncbi:hypothetical protein HK104_004123 [Borealophlyctis nickersoniae]|nr:hypothetical protein HK104_004123 [Borealophlyctis nickersoniae]
MSPTQFMPTVQLSNGVSMPALGLGTYRLKGEACRRAVKDAIEAGYRLIDTASVYKNEEDIGITLAALMKVGTIKREDLFITTKIAPKDMGEEKTYNAALESLRKLGLDYVDLLLIHWPGTQGLPLHNPKNITNRLATWTALERLHKSRKARCIGVSNFTAEHIRHLVSHPSTTVHPHVNQIEFHPMLYRTQVGVVQECRKWGVKVQGYSVFGEGRLVDGSVNLGGAEVVADRVGASIAQVLVKWALARCDGGAVIKASSKERMVENLGAVRLHIERKDLALIDETMKDTEDTRFCWDPTPIS